MDDHEPDTPGEGKIADELKLLGESLFQLGKIAFNRSRAFSLEALRRTRAAVERAADELDKTGKH